jgi:hypothetical protein
MTEKHPLAIRREALLNEIATLIDMYDLNDFVETLSTEVAGLTSEMQEKRRELEYLLKRSVGLSEQHSREFSIPEECVYPHERMDDGVGHIDFIFSMAAVMILEAMYTQHRRERGH